MSATPALRRIVCALLLVAAVASGSTHRFSAAVVAGEQPRACAAAACSSAHAEAGGSGGAWSAAYRPPAGTRSGTITDLTYAIRPGALVFESHHGLPEDVAALFQRRDRGDICNQSRLRLPSAHTGTHLDAPSHFSDGAFEEGRGVESLSLEVLNGAALLVEVPEDTNITAAALESMGIPAGVHRVLFKTLNTKRRLMKQRAFVTDYTSFTADGARWLVQHRPSVRLVGIDYLTVATYDDLKAPHEALLGSGVVAVEGLNLDELPPGLHQLHCLPVKLHGADGAPVRCISTG